MSHSVPAQHESISTSAQHRILIHGLAGAGLLTAGGLIVENMPPGWAALIFDPAQRLGSHSWGRFMGQIAFIGGIALLAHAWLRLVSRPMTDADRVRLSQRAWWLWALPLLLCPPLFSHDAWSYVAQGALTDAGIDPYRNGPGQLPGPLTQMVDPVWRFTATPYGPIPLIYGALVTHVVTDVYSAMLLMRLPVLVGAALLAWALPRLCERIGVAAGVPLALAVASPFLVTQGLAGMHNDLLVAGLIAAALAISAGQAGYRLWAAAALVGLAAGIKVTAIVAVVPLVLMMLPAWVGWFRRFATLAAGSLFAAGVLVLSGAPYGLWVGWVQALNVPGRIVSATSPPTAVGMAVRAMFGGNFPVLDVTAVPVARAIGMAAAIAITLVIALTAQTGQPRSALRSGAWIFAAVIALGPVFHTWYLFLVVPFVAPLCGDGRGRRIALVLGALLGFIAPLDSSLRGAFWLLVGTIALAVVFFSYYMERLRRRGLLRAHPHHSSSTM